MISIAARRPALTAKPSAAPPRFDAAFQAELRELLRWRRDVRRFRPDSIDEETLGGLIEAACRAPSVGLSQPWRFVIVDEPARRRAIIENFNDCNAEALAAYAPAEAAHYARLKLAGLVEAPRHLAVFADEATPAGRGLGRRTMPEMARYSAVAAVCNLWLVARAAGLGVGWVSILDPDKVAASLAVPADWRLVAYLCVGYPEREDDVPELEREGWERRRGAEDFILRR